MRALLSNDHSRLTAESDLKAVMRIEADAFVISPWKSATSFLNGKNGTTFVALGKNDEILGYVVLKIKGDVAVIVRMAVDGSHCRRGHGRRMLEWSINYAAQKRCNCILLRVRQSNSAAYALYLRGGFTPSKVSKDYYSSGRTLEERTAIVNEKKNWGSHSLTAQSRM